MNPKPGLELHCPHCTRWHVIGRARSAGPSTTADKDFLYYVCPKTGGQYFAGTDGKEPRPEQELRELNTR